MPNDNDKNLCQYSNVKLVSANKETKVTLQSQKCLIIVDFTITAFGINRFQNRGL